MAITVHLRYTGKDGSARKFAEEIRYEYYISFDDPETILLTDSWKDQTALDAHHASPMMQTISELRDKYDLHMTVERYVSIEENEEDKKFTRE